MHVSYDDLLGAALFVFVVTFTLAWVFIRNRMRRKAR